MFCVLLANCMLLYEASKSFSRFPRGRPFLVELLVLCVRCLLAGVFSHSWSLHSGTAPPVHWLCSSQTLC